MKIRFRCHIREGKPKYGAGSNAGHSEGGVATAKMAAMKTIVMIILALAGLLAIACEDGNSATRATVTARFPLIATTTRKAAAILPTPAPVSLRVGNTDKMGVYIRRAAVMSDIIKAWPDGAVMVVIGADQQAEGRLWKNIRDPDGNEGWVPAAFLFGASPDPLPQAVAQPKPAP